jgi:hypothetical protein
MSKKIDDHVESIKQVVRKGIDNQEEVLTERLRQLEIMLDVARQENAALELKNQRGKIWFKLSAGLLYVAVIAALLVQLFVINQFGNNVHEELELLKQDIRQMDNTGEKIKELYRKQNE